MDEWGKLKDLLEKPKKSSKFKKQIHQKKISRDKGSFCKARKGKIGKVRARKGKLGKVRAYVK